MPDLVKSRLIGEIALKDGRSVLKHVLGRSCVICDGPLKSLIDSFKLPRPFIVKKAAPETAGLVRDLVESGILRAPGLGEEERIRFHFAWRSAIPDSVVNPAPLPIEQDAAFPRFEPKPFKLSSALALADIDQEAMLVTHPLHSPVELDAELWRFALTFDMEAGRTPSPTEMGSVEFLVNSGVLWRSDQSEADAAARQYPPGPVPQPLDIRYPVLDRWRQSFVPYSRKDLEKARRSLSVALIGPCKIQQQAASLRYLALHRGWQLDMAGFIRPEPALAGVQWNGIFTTTSQINPKFYIAMGEGNISKLETEAKRAVSAAIDHVGRIRTLSNAPLFAFSFGRPGLGGVSSFSNEAHIANSVFAEANLSLASALANMDRAFLIDEDSPVLGPRAGVFWDDEFNSTAHHAPTSNWNWTILKAGLTDAPPVLADLEAMVPPRQPAQIDPSSVMAGKVLGALERVTVEPVRLIVFEPNDLLWRGRVSSGCQGPMFTPTVYADAENYLYAGLHEALMAVRNRGIELVCLSETALPSLKTAWDFQSSQSNVVRMEDLSFVGTRVQLSISDICAKLQISERNTLLLDFLNPPLPTFGGRVYRGDKWALRGYLLRAPELDTLKGH